MRLTLLALCLVACAACHSPALQFPQESDVPQWMVDACGVSPVVCPSGTCCPRGYACGGTFPAVGPAGECEFVEENDEPMAARRPPVKQRSQP